MAHLIYAKLVTPNKACALRCFSVYANVNSTLPTRSFRARLTDATTTTGLREIGMRDQWQQGTTRNASAFSFWRGMFGALLVAVAGWLGGSQSASAQESGNQIFQKSCAACHSIGAGRLVGPDLKGVGDKRPEDWLLKFIKSSDKLVKSGDKVATALLEEFKMPMPDQALSDDQIKKVLAHIKDTGGATAAGKETTTAPAPAAKEPAAEGTPAEIQLGGDLFEGKVRFANGGPSCNACHHVSSDTHLGGGVLAAELTLVFSRMGRQGVSAILGSSPFPVMQAAYAGKEFSDKEINALVGFLQHVDKEHARQMPKEWGWRMFSAGAGGVIVLLGIFSLAGRGRKKRCVNQDIYDRQIKSE
jgi:mono/diheme cytochrome c family protein